MNTSENQEPLAFRPGNEVRTVAPTPEASVPGVLLDPDVLARMANEFFTALPATESSIPANSPLPPSQGLDAAAGEAAHSPTLSPFPIESIPGESRRRPLPSAASGASAQSRMPPVAGGPLPEPPGGDRSSRFFESTSLSFLEDIRPLFSSAPSPSPSLANAESARALGLPSETEMLPFSDGLSWAPGSPSTDLLVGREAPQLAGTSVQPRAPEISAGYSFLSDIRELAPASTITTADQPRAVFPAVIPNLGFSPEAFDAHALRRDFPILQERIHGKPIVWLDNAATTQKPQSVIDRLSHYYSHENSNIHRAAHELAARATDAYEAAREKVRRFIGASSVKEIIFVRGATEGINLVAQSWGRQNIHKDDEIVITWLEHHANIVPWQMLCAEKGARLRVAPVDESGQVLLDEYQKLLGPRTRLVSFAQVSNALGTITPAAEIIDIAHRHGAKVLLDGAQAVSHMPVNVQTYDCDFYVFSGHKMFAPTGIGVVFGKLDILDNTQPWQGGGNMIQDVTFEKTTYQPAPGRFEAGTGNIADAVGLGAAIDYLERVGMVNVSRYEHDLLVYATEKLSRVPGLRLVGTAREKAGVLSFVLEGYRTEDVGTALNRQGIAVRAGHHCAQPILRRFGVESTVRPSLALYNTCEDVDALVSALWNLKQGHTSL